MARIDGMVLSSKQKHHTQNPFFGLEAFRGPEDAARKTSRAAQAVSHLIGRCARRRGKLFFCFFFFFWLTTCFVQRARVSQKSGRRTCFVKFFFLDYNSYGINDIYIYVNICVYIYICKLF